MSSTNEPSEKVGAMPEFYALRNWEEMQHYKHRSPKWVKLYTKIVDSEDWIYGTDDDRVNMLLCIVASALTGGKIPADPETFARILRMSRQSNLASLVDSGFLVGFDEVHGRSCYQNDSIVLLHSLSYNNNKSVVAEEVLKYLNSVTGRRFRDFSEIEKCIKRESSTLEDMKLVIDFKAKEWLDNPKMEGYLRPATLFCAKHYRSYLDEAQAGVPERNKLATSLPEL